METLKAAGQLVAKLTAITADVLARHIGRRDVVLATWLSLLSGRPAFFLGSPGVDKTGTVEDLARRIEGAVFYDALMPTITSGEQLLVESTSIEELPLAGGGKAIRTRDALGRAASAHVLFADEIWKAEPRVLQTLIDISKGDGVRHEGSMVKTPLMTFLAASNELPDPEGNLGAVWSRMTIRLVVDPLGRAEKKSLVAARLGSARGTLASAGGAPKLTLAEVETLRRAQRHVQVPDSIVETVLDILQMLLDEKSQDFSWAWKDDRRFGRLFDVMQAHALLHGRAAVSKADLAVLEWLLWDSPEQIPVLRGKLAAYTRTPLTDAREQIDALLSPSGVVEVVRKGERTKGVQAITQIEACETELARLVGEAGSDTAMIAEITVLRTQVAEVKADVIAVVTGAPRSAIKPAAAPTGASAGKGGE